MMTILSPLSYSQFEDHCISLTDPQPSMKFTTVTACLMTASAIMNPTENKPPMPKEKKEELRKMKALMTQLKQLASFAKAAHKLQ